MEADGGELGGAVVCAAVGAEQTRYRAHRHYVALARADHFWQERFYGLE